MDRDISRSRVIAGILILALVIVGLKIVVDISEWIAFMLGGR